MLIVHFYCTVPALSGINPISIAPRRRPGAGGAHLCKNPRSNILSRNSSPVFLLSPPPGTLQRSCKMCGRFSVCVNMCEGDLTICLSAIKNSIGAHRCLQKTARWRRTPRSRRGQVSATERRWSHGSVPRLRSLTAGRLCLSE